MNNWQNILVVDRLVQPQYMNILTKSLMVDTSLANKVSDDNFSTSIDKIKNAIQLVDRGWLMVDYLFGNVQYIG